MVLVLRMTLSGQTSAQFPYNAFSHSVYRIYRPFTVLGITALLQTLAGRNLLTIAKRLNLDKPGTHTNGIAGSLPHRCAGADSGHIWEISDALHLFR